MKIVTTILALTVSVIAIGGAGTIYLDYLDARSFERMREACAPGAVVSYQREKLGRMITVNCEHDLPRNTQ